MNRLMTSCDKKEEAIWYQNN